MNPENRCPSEITGFGLESPSSTVDSPVVSPKPDVPAPSVVSGSGVRVVPSSGACLGGLGCSSGSADALGSADASVVSGSGVRVVPSSGACLGGLGCSSGSAEALGSADALGSAEAFGSADALGSIGADPLGGLVAFCCGAAADSHPKSVASSVTPEITLSPGALVMLPLPSAVAIMLMPDHSMLAIQSPELGCVTVTVIRSGAGSTVCEVSPSKSSGWFSAGMAELGAVEVSPF